MVLCCCGFFGARRKSRKALRELRDAKKTAEANAASNQSLESSMSATDDGSLVDDTPNELEMLKKRQDDAVLKIQRIGRGMMGRKRFQRRWEKALQAANNYWLNIQRLLDYEKYLKDLAESTRQEVGECNESCLPTS